MFAIIALIFSGQSIYMGLTIPVFQAPDEDSHALYVSHVINKSLFTVQKDGDPLLLEGMEGFQPPLYYWGAALWASAFGADFSNLSFDYEPFSTYKPDRGEKFPYGAGFRGLHVVRLFSTLLGIVVLLFAYKTAIVFWEDEGKALLVPSLMVVHPQYVFHSSVITNDALACAIGAIYLFSLSRYLKTERNNDLYLMFILAGLGLLTKISMVVFYPVSILAVAAIRRDRKIVLRKVVSGTAVYLLVTAIFIIRNIYIYGDPLAYSEMMKVAVEKMGARSDSESSAGYLIFSMLPQTFRTFWGVFGWTTIHLPERIYFIYLLFTIFGLSGLLFKRESLDTSFRRNLRAFSAMIMVLLFISLLRWNLHVAASQARLLFPAITAFYILFADGLTARGKFFIYLRNTYFIFAIFISTYWLFLVLPGTYARFTWSDETIRTVFPLLGKLSGVYRIFGL